MKKLLVGLIILGSFPATANDLINETICGEVKKVKLLSGMALEFDLATKEKNMNFYYDMKKNRFDPSSVTNLLLDAKRNLTEICLKRNKIHQTVVSISSGI